MIPGERGQGGDRHELVLDKYRVGEKVGEGGMATVYRATHATLGREVAVKVLHPHLTAEPRNRQRFAREARAIEELKHPNILEIHDYSGADSSTCFIVTEFVRGRTLRQLLEQRGLLPSEVVALIGLRLADALAYAHKAGIVHRDLKPENVMLREDGVVKLMDFGIARFLDEAQVTLTGALVGSPAYMSPEQALERPVDGRSDLFALGTMLFQLAAGRLPFLGTNPSVILRAIIEGSRPGLLEVQQNASPLLADVVDRLLQPDPDDRYPSARELARALEAVLTEVGIDEADPTWSLGTWLASPDLFERRLEAWLDTELLERGRAALAAGRHLEAQRAFNRLLERDPDHPEVLGLLAEAHRIPDGEGRVEARGWWVWVGGLVALAGSFAGWWLLGAEEGVSEPVGGAVTVVEAPLDLLETSPTAPPEPPPPTEPAAATPAAGTPEEPAPLPGPTRRPELPPTGPLEVVAEVELPPPEPAPEVPARLVFTRRTDRSQWFYVYLDGEKVGQVPPLAEITAAPGTHELRFVNPYAEPVVEVVTVGPGETRDLGGFTFRKLPVQVTFATALDPLCAVRQDGMLLGTLGDLGHRLKVAEVDSARTLAVSCPDGVVVERSLVGLQPGTDLLVAPERP